MTYLRVLQISVTFLLQTAFVDIRMYTAKVLVLKTSQSRRKKYKPVTPIFWYFLSFLMLWEKFSIKGCIIAMSYFFFCSLPSFHIKMHLFLFRTPPPPPPPRLQPLASPKLEILPPGPPSKLETYKIMRNVRKAHITSAKSPAAGVLDVLWCNLSLILGAFYPTNL